MTHKEYKEILNYELYHNWNLSRLLKFRLKYFAPNSNCIFLARRMWYLYSRGGLFKAWSRVLYLKIMRRYGCCIYPNAKVGRGFEIVHPVGIVIGKCVIGKNFTIYQNCSVGVRRKDDEAKGLTPVVGNDVTLCANSVIVGCLKVEDSIIIGANSLVINDLDKCGTYVGSPVKKVK